MEALCFRPPPALLGRPSPPIAAANIDVRAPHHHRSPVQVGVSGRNAVAAGDAMEAAGPPAGWQHPYAYARPLRRPWPGGGGPGGGVPNEELEVAEEREERGLGEGGQCEEPEEEEEEEEEEDEKAAFERRRRAANWVLKILRVRSGWSAEERKRGGEEVLQGEEGRVGGDEEDEDRMLGGGDRCTGCGGAEGPGGCHVGEDEGEMELDRDSFVRLLRRVPLKEARRLAQLSYLGRIAYTIPRIKTANLLRYHGLRFVTSSLEKKQKLSDDDKVQLAVQGDQELGEKQRPPNVEKAQFAAQDQELGKEHKLSDPKVQSAAQDQEWAKKQKPPSVEKVKKIADQDQELEREHNLPNVEKVQLAAQHQERQLQKDEGECQRSERQQKNGHLTYSAYQIAASAASYLHSQTRSILPFRSAGSELGSSLSVVSEGEVIGATSSEMASLVATTNSVTAVVAAKEEAKQAVVEDLNSSKSPPCEWFICDDDSCRTRFFVIQGSESVASWQANLLFEPIQFEGMDVIVHRGIYEAAKGIYEQMLPHVRCHLMAHGSSATFRFTGHSLGGSLSLLVSLMLLMREEVPPPSMLPVVTFGSPYIMCGGDYLLRRLGLPRDHVKAIMMHRDIVPRAFSCNYPDHVAEILKAVNGKFRDHPCLKHQRLLYSPMGQLLILQPEEKYSPRHNLLPMGNGLYVLHHKSPKSNESTKMLRLARSMFLNTPHPLEILSDRAAYGSEGAVYRDHDVNAYLRSLRGVVRRELKLIREAKRERHRRMRRPPVGPRGICGNMVVGGQAEPEDPGPLHGGFSIVLQGGMQSLRRLGRFVASRHVHMLVLLLPSKTLLLEVFRVASFTWAR